ncbi:hypothetical protein [Sorangium atrum]|uniref:Uncharacterized protein n=1 Tax=Sorangium atrum TaxID=2995308 RepID=A0ABT5CI77_9BACT|nr:hypothetical protein [Sorangium aterium]MDC0683644.1 hypothetical protein [Sorangium aterium]MDC0684786.1 hypothetical protein [Sorangium aterium]
MFDWIRVQALIYEEVRRIHDLLVERLVAPALHSSARGPDGAAGAVPPEGATADPREREVVDVLCRAQLLLFRHPVAAQAAFSTLIAEGRRFAATPEGAAWTAALASSDLLRHGRRVWDAVSLNLLEEDPETIVPSAYLEALLSAAKSADLDGLLNALRDALGEGGRAPAR